MQYVGIDWAYRRAAWCALGEGGAVSDEGVVAADEDGVASTLLLGLLDEAATEIEGLRPDGSVRRYISRSFRAVPELLQFVNDWGFAAEDNHPFDQVFELADVARPVVLKEQAGEAGTDSGERLVVLHRSRRPADVRNWF